MRRLLHCIFACLITLCFVVPCSAADNGAVILIGDGVEKIHSTLGYPVAYNGDTDFAPDKFLMAMTILKERFVGNFVTDSDVNTLILIGYSTCSAKPVLIYDGIEITLVDNSVYGIKYTPSYKGALPFGLAFSNKLTDIIATLGNPDEYSNAKISYDGLTQGAHSVDLSIDMKESVVSAITVQASLDIESIIKSLM